MQETIAQALGLAMYGNAFLRGLDTGPFWPTASFFGYCRSVRFLVAAAVEGDGDAMAAADPAAWLRSLEAGCGGLRVRTARRGPSAFADRMSVGFVDGGPIWLIEAAGGARPLSWSARWSIADRSVEDGRIWSVDYHGLPAGPPSAPPDLDRAERDLRQSLEAIAGFAERIGSTFAWSFRSALACLDGATHRSRYHPDLAPSGLLSAQAQRILAGCDSGWVFGGMGSWNDGAYGGEDEPAGDRLSQTLFDNLQAALAGVASSTAEAFADR